MLLLEGCDQLLKPFDPLVLASHLCVFACLACLRRGQHRLQGNNIIGKIGNVQHGQSLPKPNPFCFRNLSC